MTWAPGISTISSRVDVIQGLLSSRSSARPQEPSTEAAFIASTAGFDPFGAAYQQALLSAGVAPAPAPSTAEVGASTDSAASTSLAVSSEPSISIAPGVSTAPGLSTAPGARIESAGSTERVAATGMSLSSDVMRTGALDLTIGTRRPAGAYTDPFAGMVAAANAATTYGSANATTSTTNYGTSYGSAASAANSANSVLIGATFPPVVGAGSTVGQIGGYGKMPVPAELAAYGNGQIPIDSLETIGQGGHRLYAPAAEAYKTLVAAAKVDGIDLTVTDSYRTYPQQVELAQRKGIYADGGLAAVPGTSNHGWGLAVDFNVNSPAALEWLKNNGHSFGWVEAVKREPWHWEFRPTQA